jgi:hypothetical protein
LRHGGRLPFVTLRFRSRLFRGCRMPLAGHQDLLPNGGEASPAQSAGSIRPVFA